MYIFPWLWNDHIQRYQFGNPHIFALIMCVYKHTGIGRNTRSAFKQLCYFSEGFDSCRSCECFTWIGREEPGVCSALSSLSIARYALQIRNHFTFPGPKHSRILVVKSKLEAFRQEIYSLFSSCIMTLYCSFLYSGLQQKLIFSRGRRKEPLCRGLQP